MDLDELEIATEALEEGTWVDIEINDSVFQIKVANVNSKGFLAAKEAAYSQYCQDTRKKGKKPVSEADWANLTDVSTKLLPRLMGKHLVLDWKGLTQGGKPVPFDRDLAIKLMDPFKYKNLWIQVALAASDTDNFLKNRIQEEVDELKNE